jgi:hypothetical protein
LEPLLLASLLRWNQELVSSGSTKPRAISCISMDAKRWLDRIAPS